MGILRQRQQKRLTSGKVKLRNVRHLARKKIRLSLKRIYAILLMVASDWKSIGYSIYNGFKRKLKFWGRYKPVLDKCKYAVITFVGDWKSIGYSIYKGFREKFTIPDKYKHILIYLYTWVKLAIVDWNLIGYSLYECASQKLTIRYKAITVSDRYKREGYVVCGLILICTGSLFLGRNNLEGTKALNKAIELVEGTSFYEDVSEVEDDEDIEDLPIIEVLTGDQKVKKVKKYKNVLEIPKIKVKSYIFDGVDTQALAYGVGHHTNTAGVGKSGNCVLAGHASETYKCVLDDLNKLNVLDILYLYNAKGKRFKYYIVSTFITSPDAVEILYNDDTGISTVTIYSCINGGRDRFVVVGKRFNKEELESFKEAGL